jgi:hypothetical protein
VKLPRLRRPKIVCSPSHADYSPKTNAIILFDMDHTPRGERGRNREREGNLKLECG